RSAGIAFFLVCADVVTAAQQSCILPNGRNGHPHPCLGFDHPAMTSFQLGAAVAGCGTLTVAGNPFPVTAAKVPILDTNESGRTKDQSYCRRARDEGKHAFLCRWSASWLDP